MSEQRKQQGSTALKARPKTKKPRLYRVLLHNDDYTTQEWVIHVLQRFFHKDHTEATKLMLTVHHKGKAMVGVYPFDVAETRVHLVIESSRAQGFPLLATLEPE